MYFMSEFCFVCLGISKSLTDLLKSPSESKPTVDKLHSCVSEIEWNKSQQLLICEQCIIRLNIAYEFKKQCIRSHDAIQKCIQTQRLYSGIQDQEIKDPVNKTVKIPIPNLNIKNGQLTSIAPVKIMPKSDAYPTYTNIIVANSQTKSFQNVFLNLIPTSMLNIASTTSSNVSQNNIVTTKPILQIPRLTSFKAKEKKKLEEKKDVDVAKLLNESKSEELSVEVDPLVFDTQENIAANQIDDWEDIISTQIVSQKNDIKEEKPGNVSTEAVYDDKMDFFNSGHFLFQDSTGENIVISSVQCEACGAPFGDVKSLRTHIRVNHSGDFPHKCAFCSEEFAVKKHFDSHVRKHEMEQVLTLKDFVEEHDQSVNKSADSSDDTPLYECLPCERVFNTEQGLTLHNSRRHKDTQPKDKKTYFIKGKKSAQCDICQRMFSTHSYLIQHKKLHERGLQRRGRGPNKEQVEVEEFMSRMGEQEELLTNLISKEQSGNLSSINSFAASFIEMIKNNSTLSAKTTNDQTKRSPYITYSVPKKPLQTPDVPPMEKQEDNCLDISVECNVGMSDGEAKHEPVGSIEPQVNIDEGDYKEAVSDEEYTPVKKMKKRKRAKNKSKKDTSLLEKLQIEGLTDVTATPIYKTKKKKVKIPSELPNEDVLVEPSAADNVLLVEQAISIQEPSPTTKIVESSLNGAEIQTRSEIKEEGATTTTTTENNHVDDVEVKKEDDVTEDDCDDQYKYVCVDGKPQCSYCKKLFGRKHDLRRHLNNVHLKSVQYVCHVCQKVFYEGFHLTRHLKTHFCYFNCGECSKMFVYVLPDFKNHVAHVHQNGAGAVCGVCQTILPENDMDALKCHMDVHFRGIAYTCHLCASEFRDCRDLSKHLAEQHTGPIRCVTCRKTFQTEQERERHQSRRHHGVQPTRKVERARIQCEFCTNTYLKRRYLRQHQKNVHGKEFSSIAPANVADESIKHDDSEQKVSDDELENRDESQPIDLSAKGAT